MSFYPVIQIPTPLERAYRSEPVLANFDPDQTVKLTAPPQRFSLIVLAVESAVTAIASGIFWTMYSVSAGSMILLGGMVLAAAHALLMHLTYPERWYLYHEQVDQYRKQQWETEFNQARSARMQTADGIARYRRQKVLAILAHTQTSTPRATPLNDLGKKFAAILAQWIPSNVQTTSGLVLVEEESNLHIRIELDAPYQNENGEIQVTHYAGSAVDRQFNEHHLNQGWIVIRFSEQQAIDRPDSCCKVIAEIMAELLQDESWLTPFLDVDNLVAVPQWTEFEAHRLAKLAQRQYA